MKNEFKCFFCDDRDDPKKSATGWDRPSLNFVFRNFNLCSKHKLELEAKLKIMPDPKPVERNFTEREPGEDG